MDTFAHAGCFGGPGNRQSVSLYRLLSKLKRGCSDEASSRVGILSGGYDDFNRQWMNRWDDTSKNGYEKPCTWGTCTSPSYSSWWHTSSWTCLLSALLSIYPAMPENFCVIIAPFRPAVNRHFSEEQGNRRNTTFRLQAQSRGRSVLRGQI